MPSKPMTAERLAEIAARCEAATPGPWESMRQPRPVDVGDFRKSTQRCWVLYAPAVHPSKWVADIFMPERSGVLDGVPDDIAEAVYQDVEWAAANEALLLNACQDIPDLLAEVERLQAELARLEADLPALADGVAVVPFSEVELWHPDYTNCQYQDRDSWWQADDDGSWMVMVADEEGDNGKSAPIWECYLTEAAMRAAKETT